ncbi:hypothetical protein NDN08_002055 [Rhodosorus marinus]|uniref:Secreted protein n=1 Tax=Rhodosorus marinus TaxID=101924 RepID=A0AAV8UVH1_9RHOD|nr:hypothetical protein NDN08_002055 [Rhodosorus marinus]
MKFGFLAICVFAVGLGLVAGLPTKAAIRNSKSDETRPYVHVDGYCVTLVDYFRERMGNMCTKSVMVNGKHCLRVKVHSTYGGIRKLRLGVKEDCRRHTGSSNKAFQFRRVAKHPISTKTVDFCFEEISNADSFSCDSTVCVAAEIHVGWGNFRATLKPEADRCALITDNAVGCSTKLTCSTDN